MSIAAAERVDFPPLALGRASGAGLALRRCRRRWGILRRGRRREILVKLAGLFIGTAPGAQGKDLEDEDTAIQSDRQNVAGSDSLAGGIDLVLVYPDMTGCRQLLGKRAGFGDPGVPEPLVDAQAAGGSIVFRRRNYFLSLLSIFAFKAIRAAKGEFGSIGLSLGALSRRLPPSKPFWPP